MPKKVFFSYAREDQEQVAHVAQCLRAAGFTSFFDVDLVGGQKWWDWLLARIEESDVFVPVLSSAYLRSVPCRLEVSYAIELGKTLVPLDLGAGTLFGAAFIQPIKAAQWVPYNVSEPASTVLSMIGAINGAPTAPEVAGNMQRPPAPGTDVLSTTVRLVSSSQNLTETEQWAVVGELRAHMRGEHRVAAETLLESFANRRDLLASVHQDTQSMIVDLSGPSAPAPHAPDIEKGRSSSGSAIPTEPPKADQRPRSYIRSSIATSCLSALAILLLFDRIGNWHSFLFVLSIGWLCGVAALFYSHRTDVRWGAGDESGARMASSRARLWNVIAAPFVGFNLFLMFREYIG